MPRSSWRASGRRCEPVKTDGAGKVRGARRGVGVITVDLGWCLYACSPVLERERERERTRPADAPSAARLVAQ